MSIITSDRGLSNRFLKIYDVERFDSFDKQSKTCLSYVLKGVPGL